MALSSVEKRRLAALNRLGILDTPPEARFERLTRIARQYYDVKISLFSVLDGERQWFKSRQGMDVSETPRSMAFCDYAIRQDKLLVVEDAMQDPRFRTNPLVTGTPHIRFYAGMPVREPSGFKIGSLCIIDDKPRQFNEVDLDVLRTLATLIEDELERSYLANDASEYIQVSHLNRAIHRAQNVFLTSTNERAAFEQMLSDLLALTGSELGFIGEVLLKESGEPYLKIGAVSNIAGSPEIQALYQQVEQPAQLFERLNIILGQPMVTGEVTICDNLAGDPRWGRLSPSQPPMDAYMGIPIFSEDRQIGLVGLANRRGGYREKLAEELDPLLQTVGNLIERKRLHEDKRDHEANLEQAANYDSLTSLPNRRRLTHLFERELQEANLREGQVAVCFIDLDGFKAINDEHGHVIGDAVLKTIAQRLKSTIRDRDVVARLGGDEFVAILRDVDNGKIYDRLLEVIRQPIGYNEYELHVSASMGVTVYPDDNVDHDQLMRHADQAMYAAKESGKDSYQIFDLHIHQNRKERVCILEKIDDALNSDQLELFYQPKISLQNHTLEGFEALIRWNHPDEGILSPGRFLEHIEYTEYARLVSLFVLRSAIRVIEGFIDQGLPYTVSINLSPSHFLSDQFPTDIRSMLGKCEPEVRSRIILEVLETTALDDADTVLANLGICQDLGVDISLDDFGTGYSSLTYFRELPAQEIKIDRSFVQGMIMEGDGGMIVQAILGLSRSFKRRTVAEGIETSEIEQRLTELGCDIGQGFLYSQPLPLTDALDWAHRFRWNDRYVHN